MEQLSYWIKTATNQDAGSGYCYISHPVNKGRKYRVLKEIERDGNAPIKY